MNDRLDLLKTFAPELIVLIERRYNILRAISMHQPIGRRLLAEQLSLGERIVRSELEFFKNQQLLIFEAAGVSLAPECEPLLKQLGEFVHKLRGLVNLEKHLAQRLLLERVFIVAGDLDQDHDSFRELGKLAGRFIRDAIEEEWVIAVTGGSTMAEVARNIPKTYGKSKILVVPARGGLGEEVEIQANSIAAEIAHRLGASYKLLFVPDGIKSEALEGLLLDHRVQEVITLTKGANLLLHGIGAPQIMAVRRNFDWQDMLGSLDKKPVGEAFGNYFAADGSVIFATPTVGPTLEELARLKLVVAVAGGRSKAEAIMSVIKAGFVKVLITDQGAAQCMQDILDEKVKIN